MFVVRGNGLVFTNTEQGEDHGKEVTYETREEAERAIKKMQYLFNDQKLYVEEIKVGRPTIGVTKKVSITLSEDAWEWLDNQGKRSETIRKLVYDAKNRKTGLQ